MVSHITDNGFLHFVPIGFWDNRIFLGQSIKVLLENGKILDGIIGAKPPHLLTNEEKNKAIKHRGYLSYN